MNILQQMKTLQMQAFSDSAAYADFFFGVRYNEDNAYTKIIDGKLVGAVYARMVTLHIGNKIITVPFLTGIATDSDYRNQGIAKQLIAEAETDLTARGYPFIILKPFSVAFYSNLGYTPISYSDLRSCHYSNKNELVPLADKSITYLTDKFCEIYNSVAKTHYAYLVRTHDDFIELMYEHCIDGGSGALICDNGIPKGYLLASGDSVRELVSAEADCLSRVPELDNLSVRILTKNGHDVQIMAKACGIKQLLMAVAYNKISTKATFAIEGAGYCLSVADGEFVSLEVVASDGLTNVTESALTAIALGNGERYQDVAPKELLAVMPKYNLYMYEEY